MRHGITGLDAMLAMSSLFTMAVAPPIGILLIGLAIALHCNRSSKIRRYEASREARRRARQEQARERALILAFKSLP